VKTLLRVVMAATRATKLPRPRREGPRPPLWGLFIGRLIVVVVGLGVLYVVIKVTPFLITLFLPLIFVGGAVSLMARRFTGRR